MIKNQRLKEILEYLSTEDNTSLEELASKFNVSMNTMRRDISDLAESGLVQKFYGGVKLARKNDSAYSERIVSNLDQKRKIAKKAADMVKDNDLIYIDSGTTTALLPDYINKNYRLTIVTNNLHVINKVKDIVNWEIILVGTKLKHSSHSFINFQDWDYINSLNLNKAFIAATGFTIKSGATNPDNAEAIIKINMMKRSLQSYLLLDSSKFDQTSLITFAKPDEFCKIITSGLIAQYYIDAFAKSETELIIT